MTRVRVIPVLLLADGGLVKTVRFASRRYLGDPINAVKIFNEKQVDELVLLDIDARRRRNLDLDGIEDIVSEAFMPVAYGGGVSSIEQCAELFKRGVEKVVVNTAAQSKPELITEIAGRYGAQAVVVSIDVRRSRWRGERVYVNGGADRTREDVATAARRAESLGAGELMVTSIDREGTYEGFDLDLVRVAAGAVRIPVIANGGARNVADFRAAVDAGASAVAAGSLFVYAAAGAGVLISYPTEHELQTQLWNEVA